ncbi:hypothetical protein [Methanocorpusculum vombati]|uniref:Uncharacterized protein n=1 Tax=Methanocorpusculum vombati TaxID=3002864 RepID=A0ABT4ILW0_9EURY|nr:hypothetical protein [Methanocorpusculum vombati]MCZ9312514.1 hypothetical protein [Methanocorpusculum sp.]MCZ0862745.1 hypothetical protein [Methanocorpusculum vombati]MCZ9319898.1 hypothetical protein [Methanocorpusculum sp.]MDE2520646.1 hypothetical protein [Methanocorpusculum sp.]MDE2534183.1 hypothetical protein [Methanocorpusculum sp.]
MTTDLRSKVEEDRGLLKKIQMGIPGFRGYRQKEDLRIADSLLRMQVADLLKSDVLGTLELIRERAGNALELDLMNDIATVVSAAKTAETRVRHAEQGYSGISPAYRVTDEQLNTLYEFDVSLVDGIRSLGKLCRTALGSADAGDFGLVKADLRDIRAGLAELLAVFEKRIETMAGLGAF